MIKALVWVEVEPEVADNAGFLQAFQAAATKKARDMGIQLGEMQVDREGIPGKVLLMWEERDWPS